MSSSYPLRIDADLDPSTSRWLWLVKWLLAIPHYFVLAFLWLAFVLMTVVAFFAILFTGRYPRGVFDFNVGVLRWSWRVTYYTYGVAGTDRYPPFTLHEVPDYPAHLTVDYPGQLSRGLVLVKWWLLAIPHYLVTGLFVSGSAYAASTDGEATWGIGLIGLLVLIALVTLLFTGRYPTSIFDLVMGLNRWVLRVAGYASLMTDTYPPFRLDQGGQDSPVAVEPLQQEAAPVAAAQHGETHPSGWSAGRVVTLVVGCLLAALALGFGVPATAVLVADTAGRDDAGFLMSEKRGLTSPTYAVTSRNLELHTDAPPEFTPRDLLGDAKLTATPQDATTPVFIGLARTSDVDGYLSGVQHDMLLRFDDGDPVYRHDTGASTPAPPEEQDFWVAQSSGTGLQELTWQIEDGDWTVVVMNAEAEPRVAVDVAAGAEVPALGWLAGILFAIAGFLLLVGIILVIVSLRLVSRASRR